MPTQAQINADRIKNLILIIDKIEKRQNIINTEVIKILDYLDKINKMVLYIYNKEKKDDIKTEPIKSGWFY
tara:strand:- start:1377 stop:1589 length:213 start_codon:yes stop_codon:yes gene_type:complete